MPLDFGMLDSQPWICFVVTNDFHLPLPGERKQASAEMKINRSDRTNQRFSGIGREFRGDHAMVGPRLLSWDKFILDLKKTTKEFIENVLENIIESIVVTNLEGHLIFFNKFSEEMFEYSADEVLNRHIAVLGAIEPDVLGHIRQNRSYHGEIFLTTKGGRRFPAHVRCVPLRDEHDRPIAMVGVARDLTREKDSELIDRKMAILEAFNENLISSLNDGIQILNLQGIVTFANNTLEDLLECGRGELEGLHYSGLVVAEGRSLIQALLGKANGRSGRSSFETWFFTNSGKRLPVLVTASPFIDPTGLAGVIMAITDLSEVRRLKEELFQSEKMSLIGTLASEVAHEINNPLGGLIMAVDMLSDDLKQGQFQQDSFVTELAEIRADALRCRRIVQKLLEFSRRMPEEKALVSLNDVIEDSMLLVQRQIELDGINFSKSYYSRLLPVWGNSNELQQVIINLIKNARDAMLNGGRISLSTSHLEQEGTVLICACVSDTGPGISEEIADRIFEPFFTTKERGKGTGLGLAVGRRIVKEHGGFIAATNNPGGGALFRVVIPAAVPADHGKADD
jgi:PAS domain S-box-containing protein